MKTILPQLLLGLILLQAGLGQTRAAEEGSTAVPPAKSHPATGKVLLLQNEHTLEGDIERVGDQYRLRRSIGEAWVPAGRVLHLCGSNEEAYLFLRDRSNLKDPDERLKLAQWCHLHGLRAQALSEAQAAVTLQPEHVPSQRMLAHLQKLAAENRSAPATPRREETEPMPALHIELTGEALGQFTSRVQPILMNSCASCHAGGRGGSFKLVHAPDSGNRRVTQQNLAEVLLQINPHQPESSPFLAKALAVHGGISAAPFRNRETPAYRMLEDWVRLTVDNHPRVTEMLRNDGTLPTALPSGGQQANRNGLALSLNGQARPNSDRLPLPDRPTAGEQPAAAPASPSRPAQPISPTNPPSTQQSLAQPDPNDPHDPAWFNQQNPGQTAPGFEAPAGAPEK